MRDMRRLSKPWAPANVSPGGQEQRSFATAEAEYLASLDTAQERTKHARSEFDRLEKRELRSVMFAEQGSLCVYCERSIRETLPPPPVEHWKPLSEAHEFAVH